MKKPIYNPSAQDKFNDWILDDLSPENLVNLRDSILSGETYLIDSLYRTMNHRWPALQKCLSEKASAVERLIYSVIPWAANNEKPTPLAQDLAGLIDDSLFSTAEKHLGEWELSFSELINALTYTLARGTCVFRINWKYNASARAWLPSSYTPVLPQYYGWSVNNNEPDKLLFYPRGINGGRSLIAEGAGQEFSKDDFIVSMSQRGVDHPIFNAQLYSLVGYFGASMHGLAWYMQYTEIFGVPFRHLKVRSENDIAEAERLFQTYGTASYAVTTKGTELEIHNAAGGAQALPQHSLLSIADAQCEKLILGQTLTSSQGDKGSQALGTVHNSVREDFLEAAAKMVVDVINTQLIPAIVRKNYGSVQLSQLPRLDFKTPGKKYDLQRVDYVGKLTEMGVQLSEYWVYDFLDLPMPEEGAKLFQGRAIDGSILDDIQAARANRRPKLPPSP